jgi:ubiquinone/menaquinone biosynthesis C-methylase UbiE
MRRLTGVAEHLDGPLDDDRIVAGNLRDLARINRWLGGVGLSERAIDVLAERRSQPSGEPMRLLDLGTGGADIPAALLERQAAGRGWPPRLEVTAVDLRSEILAAAVAVRPELETMAGLELAIADGRDLPFEDGQFDIAHASLLLHHLDPPEARAVLAEMGRVATVGVVINDLARSWLTWIGAWLVLHLVTRNRWTRHDGPLSVRRAYTVKEASTLLSDAGLTVIHVEQGFASHRWAIAAVPAE